MMQVSSFYSTKLGLVDILPLVLRTVMPTNSAKQYEAYCTCWKTA